MKENYRALLQDNKIQRQRREQIQEKNVKTIQKERKKKKRQENQMYDPRSQLFHKKYMTTSRAWC